MGANGGKSLSYFVNICPYSYEFLSFKYSQLFYIPFLMRQFQNHTVKQVCEKNLETIISVFFFNSSKKKVKKKKKSGIGKIYF